MRGPGGRHPVHAALRAAALVLAACGGVDAKGDPDAPEPDAAADSATAQELARFRTGLTEPTGLTAGASSPHALFADFVTALEAADTAALVRMHLTAAEFAWLYYPESQYARRPYRQDPALFWMLLRQNSEKGVLRLLRSYAGRALDYGGARCEAAAKQQGRNRLWERCLLLVRPPDGGEPEPTRLFGSILARDGRFKFVSYANDL